MIYNQQQLTIALLNVLVIQTMPLYLNDWRIMHDGSPINTNLRTPTQAVSIANNSSIYWSSSDSILIA